MRDTNCPNCGAPVYPDKRKCPYCDTPYKEMGEISRAYDTNGKVVVEFTGADALAPYVKSLSDERLEYLLFGPGGGGGSGGRGGRAAATLHKRIII